MENNKPYIVMVVVLLFFFVGILGLYWYFTTKTLSNKTANTTNNEAMNVVENVVANKSIGNEANNTVTNSANNAVANNTTTTPGTGKTSSSGNVTISTPKNGDTIGKVVTITGYARTFENVVNMRVKDATGKILASGFTTANAPDVGKTGPFSKSLSLTSIPSGQKGTVEVYDLSAADGSEQDIVSVSVTFQ